LLHPAERADGGGHPRTRESDDHRQGHVGLDDDNERPGGEVEDLPPHATGGGGSQIHVAQSAGGAITAPGCVRGAIAELPGVCAEPWPSSLVRSARASGGRNAVTTSGCVRRAMA
jgi:hypothetical protein